jgi:hypothetical protein
MYYLVRFFSNGGIHQRDRNWLFFNITTCTYNDALNASLQAGDWLTRRPVAILGPTRFKCRESRIQLNSASVNRP